eukprot:UC4_evm1s653
MKQRFIDFPKSYPVKKNRTGEIVTSEDGEVAFWAQEGSEGLRLGIKNGFIVVRWGQNFELTTKIQMKLGVWTAVGMTWGMSDGKLSVYAFEEGNSEIRVTEEYNVNSAVGISLGGFTRVGGGVSDGLNYEKLLEMHVDDVKVWNLAL